MLARNLIPDVPFVASNPLIRFSGEPEAPRYMYWVNEIEDKPRNTQSVMKSSGIGPDRVVIVGDSGGDGPHFRWGGSVGAYLIGSMVKPSLEAYCRDRAITINKHFGYTYSAGEARDRAKEMQTDFMELTETLSEVLDLSCGTCGAGNLAVISWLAQGSVVAFNMLDKEYKFCNYARHY